MEYFGLLIVGRTGTGKTTQVKKLLDNLHNDSQLIIYDVNNEYSEYQDLRFEPDINVFMSSIVDITDTVIVIDEASIFFENRATNKEIKKLLALKRHNRNIIILNFHSFAMIPDYIFHLVNYVTVLKTNDSSKKVQRKFDNQKLIDTIERVNSDSFEHYQESINLY